VVLSTDPGNGTYHRSSAFSKRRGVTISALAVLTVVSTYDGQCYDEELVVWIILLCNFGQCYGTEE
jgi:hypothetical protein